MSHFNVQINVAVAYPPPASAPVYVVPPPPRYLTRDAQQPVQNTVPIETETGGGSFWEGCCAALRCCCVLVNCF